MRHVHDINAIHRGAHPIRNWCNGNSPRIHENHSARLAFCSESVHGGNQCGHHGYACPFRFVPVVTIYEQCADGNLGLCIMSGPLVGGAIANRIGWQWAFWINIPTTAASFIAILFSFPEEKPRTSLFTLPMVEKIKRLDPIGSALLVISLSCLICALQDYSKSTSLSPTGVVVAALAGAAFPLFLLQEVLVRPELALIPSSMVKRRSVWSCACTLFFLFSGFTNFMFFVSIFQQVSLSQERICRESSYVFVGWLIDTDHK